MSVPPTASSQPDYGQTSFGCVDYNFAAGVFATYPLDKLARKCDSDVGGSTMLAWSVRWTLKGLMPIKPHLILNYISIEVPSKSAFEII